MRTRTDLDTVNPGPRAISLSFPDTEGSLKAYDSGEYCHHSSNSEKWPYWGDTAIPKKYVQDKWTGLFTYLDFLEVGWQNVIVVQKPF